ncbi:hypothetical protein [Lysinibacillus sphaericus]|uniref:Peptidase U32 n=1 Tax=Lysinibacillus sphaericus OT4b.31 TaxID=1285586 RepID=R7ZHP1_LYSSH|nr:hypothetical protein [Lysinibacillus sphaericus]EON73588.1 hypothetical protein H131_06343 [Lysinibacillus sphaericus OT4b.31]
MKTPLKELRIHHEYLYEVTEEILGNYQVVSLGHSGCHYKMNGIEEQHILYLLERDKRVKIEMPILFETAMNEFFTRMQRFFHYEINLIINDWGTMRFLAQQQLPSTVSLSVGRQLAFSYGNCPWYEDILQYEDQTIKENYLQLNIANPAMIKLLKEHGVAEIDADLNAYMKNSVNLLRDEGIKVNGFLHYPMVSTSRSCHTLRLYNEPLGNCQHLCNNGITIEPRERWNRFEDVTVKISKENREKMGNLIIYGNIVVQDIKRHNESIPFEVDSLCDDARFSPILLKEEAIK